MTLETLNLILLILIIIMLFSYLFIRVFFSSRYLAHEVPHINSGNDVISNLDLTKVVDHYQKVFQLQNYEIKFAPTESFYTLDKGLSRSKKTITFSKPVFSSVGYELDYLLGTMWFISQKVVKKNSRVKFYSFTNRFGFNINLVFLIIFGLISLALYLFVGVANNGEINNKAVQFLWQVPIFQILAFLTFVNGFIIYLILSKIKPTLERQYSKELEATFSDVFKEYRFDLGAARVYASELPLAHNFAFRTFVNQNFKWLGPFVKY